MTVEIPPYNPWRETEDHAELERRDSENKRLKERIRMFEEEMKKNKE